jgi:hypothetical protein
MLIFGHIFFSWGLLGSLLWRLLRQDHRPGESESHDNHPVNWPAIKCGGLERPMLQRPLLRASNFAGNSHWKWIKSTGAGSKEAQISGSEPLVVC